MVMLTASDLYSGVEQIQTIVKQLKGYSQHGLSNKAAGALTSSTLQAMKNICDEAAGEDSHLSVRNTTKEGWTYVRTLSSGQKLQVISSSGKHINAILAFLEWAKTNTPNIVKYRPLHMVRMEKLKFFTSLRDLSLSAVGPYQMETLRLSDHAVQLLHSGEFFHPVSQVHLADLILIGLNKNSQYVSALTPSYRTDASRTRV